MNQIGHRPCLADPDVWMKPETREDGFKHYAYILMHVDDVIAIHHDALRCIKSIDKYFPMKPDSIGDPSIYLGAKMKKVRLDNGVEAWTLSASQYIQESCRKVLQNAREKHACLKLRKSSTPMASDYRPELDISEELDHDDANYCQSAVGMLRWIVELGRIDIITEVSMMSSHMAAPRVGHLERVFQMYSCLANKHNARLVFDPSYPDIKMSAFVEGQEWEKFCGDVREEVPPNRPEPLWEGGGYTSVCGFRLRN